MSWPISHTSEALTHADANIRKLSRAKLIECARAWRDERGDKFNPRKLPTDTLADYVAEHALGESGSCTNGGHELYCDPDGYVTVPFDATPD